MGLLLVIIVYIILLFILSVLIARLYNIHKLKNKKCNCIKKAKNIPLDALEEKTGYPLSEPIILNNNLDQLINIHDKQYKNHDNDIIQEEDIIVQKFQKLKTSIGKYIQKKNIQPVFNNEKIENKVFFNKDVISNELRVNLSNTLFKCIQIINHYTNSCYGKIEYNSIYIEKDNLDHFRIKSDIFLYELRKNYEIRVVIIILISEQEVWLQNIDLYNKLHNTSNIKGIITPVHVETVPKSSCQVIRNYNSFNRWIIPDVPDTMIVPNCCNEISQWDHFGICTNPNKSRRCGERKVSEMRGYWPNYKMRDPGIYRYLFSLTRGIPGIPSGISNK